MTDTIQLFSISLKTNSSCKAAIILINYQLRTARKCLQTVCTGASYILYVIVECSESAQNRAAWRCFKAAWNLIRQNPQSGKSFTLVRTWSCRYIYDCTSVRLKTAACRRLQQGIAQRPAGRGGRETWDLSVTMYSRGTLGLETGISKACGIAITAANSEQLVVT